MLCVMSSGEMWRARCVCVCVCVEVFVSGLCTGQRLTCSLLGLQQALFYLFSYQWEARGISVVLILFSFFAHIRATVYSGLFTYVRVKDASSPRWIYEHLKWIELLCVFSSRPTCVESGLQTAAACTSAALSAFIYMNIHSMSGNIISVQAEMETDRRELGVRPLDLASGTDWQRKAAKNLLSSALS